jgi:hypothetical protein
MLTIEEVRNRLLVEETKKLNEYSQIIDQKLKENETFPVIVYLNISRNEAKKLKKLYELSNWKMTFVPDPPLNFVLRILYSFYSSTKLNSNLKDYYQFEIDFPSKTFLLWNSIKKKFLI